MKKILTIILLLLSTILYSQTPVKVEITTEDGRISKYFEENQVMHHLYCIDIAPCNYILFLDKGDYGYLSVDNRRTAWFRVDSNSVYILDKSKDLTFTIIKE